MTGERLLDDAKRKLAPNRSQLPVASPVHRTIDETNRAYAAFACYFTENVKATEVPPPGTGLVT